MDDKIKEIIVQVVERLKEEKSPCWNREYKGKLMFHWEYDGQSVTDVHIDYNGIPYREIDCKYYKEILNIRLQK